MELQAQNMFCACSFHGNSMNNLFSYCGLVDARISASEKDLPVRTCTASVVSTAMLGITGFDWQDDVLKTKQDKR